MVMSLTFLAELCCIILLFFSISYAQTAPMNTTTDFSCSRNSSATCDAYVFYRAQSPDYLEVGAISDLFAVSRLNIKTASNLASEDARLVPGQLLLVGPMPCGCTKNMSYANRTYAIKEGDSFYLVSVNNFERLTDYGAVEALNPTLNPTLLKIGVQVIFPLYCKCPTSAQLAQGINHLLTYVWQEQDTVTQVSHRLNASEIDIEAANFRNFTAAIGFPVLIPVKNLPVLSQPLYPMPSAAQGKAAGHSIVPILVGAIAALVIVVICCMVVYFKHYRTRKDNLTKPKLGVVTSIQSKNGASEENFSPRTLQDKLLPGVSGYLNKPVMYDMKTIMAATNNLSEKYRIGGSVYRVYINGNYFAVKQTKGDVAQELSILQRVSHANLVKLSGISMSTNKTCFLVYEFAENGSLDKWLHPKLTGCSSSSLMFLSWRQRLTIALDVAHGLQYMHEHTSPSIVHKDIRTSNILLSSQFKAKISNFSMARPAADNVALKTDVYAFGLLLLELLSGRKAMETREDGEMAMLWQDIKMVLECEERREERLKEWMDPNLEGFFPIEGALNLATMAKACTCEKPSARPMMGEVVFGLSVLTQSNIETRERSWTDGVADEVVEHIIPVVAR